MAGLQKILRLHGSIKVKGDDGKEVTWLWDYKNEKPRLKYEMTDLEIAESEKERLIKIKDMLSKNKNSITNNT